MKNNNVNSINNNDPSKQSLEEFGLTTSGKEKLVDKIGKPGEYANNQNAPGLVEEYMNQYGVLVDKRDPLANTNSQGNTNKNS